VTRKANEERHVWRKFSGQQDEPGARPFVLWMSLRRKESELSMAKIRRVGKGRKDHTHQQISDPRKTVTLELSGAIK